MGDILPCPALFDPPSPPTFPTRSHIGTLPVPRVKYNLWVAGAERVHPSQRTFLQGVNVCITVVPSWGISIVCHAVDEVKVPDVQIFLVTFDESTEGSVECTRVPAACVRRILNF